MPLLPISRTAAAQALPAGEAAPISTGFALPSTAGSLRYSLGFSQSFSNGYYNGGTQSSTGANGNLAFISTSAVDPFSVILSAGDSWSSTGQPSTYFLNLGLSQVFTTRLYTFVVSDSVSYLPQTAATGISGVPGTGDVGLPPIVIGTDTGQGLLTDYSSRVTNSVAVSASHRLTGKTSLSASGSYYTLYFLGNDGGINTSSEGGGLSLSHVIDARNTISASYGCSQFNYGVGQTTVTSQSATGQFSHQFTRRFNVNVSTGPQWSSYTSTPTNPSSSVPINLFVSASANYTSHNTAYSLTYSRGTNTGSGVIEGARSDSVGFRASRTFARVWNGSVSASYTRTTSLVPAGAGGFAPETVVSAVQLSRAIARSLSVYGSYTLEDQTTPGSMAPPDFFSGLYRVASFGLTYSPTPLHFGPR